MHVYLPYGLFRGNLPIGTSGGSPEGKVAEAMRDSSRKTIILDCKLLASLGSLETFANAKFR